MTVATPELKAPFPYFGGKSRCAAEVWRRFGAVANYVEPFFGSGAVLLSGPDNGQTETVNDINGYICNFWRAVQNDPEATAEYADWPVIENDLHARHVWLVQRKESMRAKLEGDPDWYDAKAAGWWCWGLCNWIGSGWCDGISGPWWVEGGELVKQDGNANGVKRQRVQLGNKGRGVSRQLVHLGDKRNGVTRQLVHLGSKGQGVSRQRVHLGDWFAALSARLARTRVCCGDWSRVCTSSVTTVHGITGVFLDPPYAFDVDGKTRDDGCYGQHDSGTVAHDVSVWCIEHADDKQLRIALCGYEGEHELPGWREYEWKTGGGMANQGTNGSFNQNRERIWFSPGCLTPQPTLF